MSYPTPSEYQEAIQVPESAFADPELQTAEPRTNVLGLPQPITGAFAAVFPMTTKMGEQYAVKCFLSDVSDQRTRYEAIAAHLDTADLEATVEFEYQESGIEVNGASYPVLKMEWVEGTTVNRFVDAHLDASDVLLRISDRWMEVMESLEEAEVAHGDLQHGNILVQDDGGDLELRLVDYDTMYVPALSGRSAAEVGHRNYQHPDRTDVDFGPYLDRFAGLAIYTALRACALRPDLWDRFDAGENLLFRDDDFYAPDESPLFAELETVDDLAPLPEVLRRACFVEPEAVPSLRDVEDGDPVLDRLAVTAEQSRRRSSSAGQERGSFARTFLLVSVAVIATTISFAVAGSGGMALILGGAASALGAWEVGRRYRALPLVRRQRRLQQEIDRIGELIDSLRRQIDSLKTKRREVLDTVAEQREKRLQEVQEEALYDQLKHHFVGEAREVEGVTHKHVVRLKSANIRTAYEATPERIEDIRQLSDKTKARLRMWRAALVNEYEEEIPDELSPAEERRLQRYVQHRVEDIDDEIARATEKVEVQSVERDRLRERKDEMPDLSLYRYLRYLLRLDTLPILSEQTPVSGDTDRPDRSGTKNADSLPQMHSEEEGPWWEQRDA